MWALRGNECRLKAGQRELRERLPRQYSKLGRALSRRDFLADTWRYAKREDAEEHLAAVCSWGRRCRPQPIKKLCDHPAPLEGNPRLRQPLDHERGHGGSQQLAPFGPQEGQGIPQLGELPNHRLLDRGRAQSRNRPAEPDPDALLNTIRFGEVPRTSSPSRSATFGPAPLRPRTFAAKGADGLETAIPAVSRQGSDRPATQTNGLMAVIPSIPEKSATFSVRITGMPSRTIKAASWRSK